VLIVLVSQSLKIAGESERFAVFVLGRFLDFRGPGLILVIPFTQRIVRLKIGDIGRVKGPDFVTIGEVDIPIDGLTSFRVGQSVRIDRFDGASELRAGVYTFWDVFQAGLGCCTVDDIALSVLTTVNGIYPAKNRLIVDAGALALSADRSTAGHDFDAGYGLVCDAGGEVIDDLIVANVNQEHGLISTRSGAPLPFERFSIGTQLRILPNHACMTAAMYDHYYVVDGDDTVVETWERCKFW